MTQQIKKLVLGLAETFGENLSVPRLQIYARVLGQLSEADIERAIEGVLTNPAITRFPLPAQILELVKPTLSIEAAAQELLQRCTQAVAKFGYSNPTEAKHYLGETAWRAIGEQTGWVQFCCAGDKAAGGIEIGTARAQLRESIKSKLTQEYPNGRVSLPKPNEGEKLYLPILEPEDVQLQNEGHLTSEQREKRIFELQAQLARIGKSPR